ncbi:MAG TPA: DUF6065 family protein [Reyranella sp.]|nr:DUF6065 family protein [Reyranella sp.]
MSTTEKLIAYELYPNTAARLRQSRRERKWMDDTENKYAYRCLPMVIANQFGWDILSPHHIRATWDGSMPKEAIRIEVLYGDGPSLCTSHFGSGVLTFSIPYLFKTPPGWNMMVRGPTNSPKDGISALDGIVETDTTHSTFTMNWKFTRACTIEFALHEPICMVHPIQRGLLDMFEPALEPLANNAELKSRYEQWSAGRGRFNASLLEHEATAVKQGWEKDYFRSAAETKVNAGEFRRKE